MTVNERNEFYNRIERLRAKNITLSEDIIPETKIRGVYGFFCRKENEIHCFYIGKSNNILIRMLGKNSHLNNYLRGVKKSEVHKAIDKYLNDDFSVEIKVLQSVPYVGDSFEKDANRLALAELQQLVAFQSMGECTNQLSEAVKKKFEKEEWENLFSTNNKV